MRELKEKFEALVERARQMPMDVGPELSVETRILMYALYMQAIEGDVAGEGPGQLEREDRVIYDARLRLKGTSQEHAMREYIRIALTTEADHTGMRAVTMPTTPWWKALPQDLNQTPYATILDHRYVFKVRGTAAFDVALRTAVASLLTIAASRTLMVESQRRRDLELLELYRPFADRADREEVFPRPPRGIAVERLNKSLLAYQPKGLHTELLGFKSPYQTLVPEIRADYVRHHANRQVVAQHWRHPEGPRPTLIFTHGYLMDASWMSSLMFSLRWLYKKGYDILLYTLPFHGTRAGKSDLFTGHSYFANGFAQMNEAFLQAVYDLRIWIDYLEEQGAPAIGVSGFSLGGYVSALAASADSRLAFAIPNAPAVLLPDTLFGWYPMSWVLKYTFGKQGKGLADFRHTTAVHCPLTWAPLLPPERLLVIGGAGDRFTAPQFVNALHEHWAGSQMHWFPGNHLMHLHQRDYLRLMKRFMDQCCAPAVQP